MDKFDPDNNGTRGISDFWDAAFGISMLICTIAILIIIDGIARGWQ